MKNKILSFMYFKSLNIILLLFFLLTSFRGSHTNPIKRQGKDHAVFFAVKDYDHWDDLQTPIKDAKAISNILKEKYNFTTEILENPTKLEIKTKIVKLQNQSFHSEDQLLFFFTGHGEFVPSLSNPQKGKGYFIPKDAKQNDLFRESYLYYPDIKPDIDDIPCEHILIMIDACFSGSFLQYRGGDERPGKLSDREKLINTCMKKRCRKGITSGGNERTKDGIDHSPFSDRFLSALNSLGGHDQILTFNELFSKLESLSPQPKRGYFGTEDSDSKFLFIAKRNEYNDHQAQQSGTRQVDLLDWKTTKNKHTIEAYRLYISKHQNGQFVYKAQETIAVLEDEMDWQIALELNTVIAFEQYIVKYPKGKYILDAKGKLFGTFTDIRDNIKYKWVLLKDDNKWMAENLTFKIGSSWCYENKKENCKKYGRLYSWEAAIKACPLGWHLPSDSEWQNLALAYGGFYEFTSDNPIKKTAYNSLIEGGNSKFNALLGGHAAIHDFKKQFFRINEHGIYWSSSANSFGDIWCYEFDYRNDPLLFRDDNNIGYAFSCRCIQD